MEPIDQLKSEARHIRLSAEASKRMRERVAAHMRANPALVRSPYQKFMHVFRIPVAALSVVLLVGVGGATSYAALGSLPGDPLYPMKVGVIEPMQAALAFTPQAKALLRVKVAETRASEEVKLAEKNKLTPEQGVILKNDLDMSLGSARKTIEELRKDDPESADKLDATLTAALDAHESALSAFATATSTATSTAEEARSFAEHIRKKAHPSEGSEATSTPDRSSGKRGENNRNEAGTEGE